MVLQIPTKGWWETDQYGLQILIPAVLEHEDLWGPKGPAIVKAYSNGTTQVGWGLNPPRDSSDGFMPRYLRGEFLEKRASAGYDQNRHAVAFVMRSARLIVVDIDGKNGGLQGIHQLGNLPFTLAETSKSGTGYHLWYITPESWDDDLGFSEVGDAIGIAPGVDIRNVGCVYHWQTQRWNSRSITPVPANIWNRLREKKVKQEQAAAAISSVITTGDETEILIMQDALIDDLAKPIPAGQRNTTLFAIGNKMRQAGIPDWKDRIELRAVKVGLDPTEAERITANIAKQP